MLDIIGLEQIIATKLTARKCIAVSFEEVFKDLPVALVTVFISICFPWRISYLCDLWS